MALTGTYVPSTAQWVRDQVAEYEASNGERANTLRDTGYPIVVITSVGAKSGHLRKNPVMRVERDGELALVLADLDAELATKVVSGEIDSYEVERRAIAKGVVMLTGLAYALEVSELWPFRVGRGLLAGPIASVLLPSKTMTSLVARVVSGLDWRYRRGAISADGPGGRAGKRLPDIRLSNDGGRLHDLIDGVGFHLVVHGDLPASSLDVMNNRFGSSVETHVLDSGDLNEAHGDLPGWDLVRPDGYIAASGTAQEFEGVLDYLGRWLGPGLVLQRLRG